jgi:hypothetical protein
MRAIRRPWAVLLFMLVASHGLAGTTTVETFDGGSNQGGWTWGTGGVLPAGGNPGPYLDSANLDTFAPQPRTTQAGSVFTGDFRARKVSSFGVDLITLSNSTTAGRPLTLMLMHDPGTPGDPFDDTAAYFMGPNIPHFGEGWLEYDYVVPSQETTLPTGWLLLNMGDIGQPANHSWDEVIQDVDQVRFFYGDPTFFFIFQLWNVGLDNPRITEDLCEPQAGAVPDGQIVPGTMLQMSKAFGGSLRLSWGESCNSCDSDYGIYEGDLGDFTSHQLKSCSTGGLTQAAISPDAGDTYYLIVPSNGLAEGSYGHATSGERLPGGPACLPHAPAPCF